MTEPESNITSIASSLAELQKHQKAIAKYMAGLKRRLDKLTVEVNQRATQEQFAVLQQELNIVQQYLDSGTGIGTEIGTEIGTGETPVLRRDLETGGLGESDSVTEKLQALPRGRKPDCELVWDSSEHRAIAIGALEKVIERLIIVSPWLSRNRTDSELLQKLKNALERNCQIDIGWGDLADGSQIGRGQQYDALDDLRELQRDFPEQLRLKLLATNENFLVCDRAFALIGSYNFLGAREPLPQREVGIQITDSSIIQELINRFDAAEELDEEELRQQFSNSANTDMPDADLEEDEDEEDDTAEDEANLQPPIAAEEFWQRYVDNKRDFSGSNLAGINLSRLPLYSVNLSRANLKGANLSAVDCDRGTNLSGANLKGAELSDAKFSLIDLSEANFSYANLHRIYVMSSPRLGTTKMRKANLRKAKLTEANLAGANLSEANFSGAYMMRVNLGGADLTGANLSKISSSRLYLRKANLKRANLSHANLADANLLEANLQGANLEGVKLERALYNQGTIFPIGFDPIKAGACFIGVGVSLPNANLAGLQLKIGRAHV